MDYKKTNAPTNTVTRDVIALSSDTGNVYETIRIIGKRANQISVEMKNDLEKKLQERKIKEALWIKRLKPSVNVRTEMADAMRFIAIV